MNYTLLVLDENADVDDMINAYREVNRLMREKHNSQGITFLANDEAINGNESEFSERADIRFFPNWQTNPEYRDWLRLALQSENKYVMKRDEDGWGFIEAENLDLEISDYFGLINIKPNRFKFKK